jgi:uncharacterized protein
MSSRTLAVFAVILLLAVAVNAQDSNIGELRKKADAGDAKAQNELGVAYRMGDGIARNKQEALKWYLMSARQAFSDAMFNLGTAYYNGDGVPSDVNMANAWFIIAADHGSTEARSAIERIKTEEPKPSEYMYDRFVGIIYATELAPNETKAFEWLRKAAKLKNNVAAAELCFRSINGEGLKKDTAAAVSWCDVAGKAGDVKALIALGDIYSRGDGLRHDAKKAVRSY